MVATMGIGLDLPHTSQSKSWCEDGEVYRWRWFVHVLGLKFQLGVGSVIENTVFIGESLNAWIGFVYRRHIGRPTHVNVFQSW